MVTMRTGTRTVSPSPRRTTDSTAIGRKRWILSLSFILLIGSSIMKRALVRDLFKLGVVGEGTGNTVKQEVEGKLDTCGSVSLSHSSHKGGRDASWGS
jgi:hypothetical protein